MNIKKLNEFLKNNALPIDKTIPPTVDYDAETITFHVNMLKGKADIDQWLEDNDVFTVNYSNKLMEVLDDGDFEAFIAFHYGPDDLDIYRIFIRDIVDYDGKIIIYKTSDAILEKKIRPTTYDCSKNAPSTSTEGDKWDRILKKLDILIEMLEDREDDDECDDEDEDCDECGGCDGCDDCCDGCCDDEEDEVEDVDEDDEEDEDEVEETPKFDTYSCSLEGKLGPDGVFHVKETTNDGKVIEKSVQFDAKDGSDGILKKLAGLAEDIRKAGGGINLNDMIP